jgi:hypothetical protein
MGLKDRFQFSCHKGLSCFTQCCWRLEILLTPYDILCLKKGLNISSEAFLERYTQIVFPEKIGLPMLALKKEDGKCPFLKDTGCQLYAYRPTVCRLYPLGRAFASHRKEEVYFLLKEPGCLGFEEEKNWTVAGWIKSQCLEAYEKMNKGFSELIFLKTGLRPDGLNLKETKMFFMSCYNLDAFKEFVLTTSFSQRFALPKKEVKKVSKDGVALLQLSFKWLKFALFGQPTLKLQKTENR